MKAIQNKYKQIMDKLRRSGGGYESAESELVSNIPYCMVLDAVLGRRASDTPV